MKQKMRDYNRMKKEYEGLKNNYQEMQKVIFKYFKKIN